MNNLKTSFSITKEIKIKGDPSPNIRMYEDGKYKHILSRNEFGAILRLFKDRLLIVHSEYSECGEYFKEVIICKPPKNKE